MTAQMYSCSHDPDYAYSPLLILVYNARNSWPCINAALRLSVFAIVHPHGVFYLTGCQCQHISLNLSNEGCKHWLDAGGIIHVESQNELANDLQHDILTQNKLIHGLSSL